MGTSLKDKMNQLSPDRQARINAEADRLHEEYLTLQQLRKAKDMTQVQLAETLGIRQASVAQMEKRSDLMLSTLRSYVEAMGGKLNLMVEFPDRAPVLLDGLTDTEELPARKPSSADQSARSA
ncbi:helix-turn-helix domain-containing protein [Cohaesibacter celericrescens]|uniref:Transcriptional regulator n=1 Tax=Cohaesibacter celericrescens TaxID=2067669 RepID=A0A2N5XPW3_9HYPH|nr:XRE family transcriptional regulator [Cohaesibacter celericrescens]PLW76552.1 transcriptional regulator [Cohaesibacter celericrescens]